MKRVVFLSSVTLIIFLIITFIIGIFGGFKVGKVDAGYEGYQVNKPYFIGKHSFVGIVTGPSSTGLTWRDFITEQIDMRPNTYMEEITLLTSDNLQISFAAHLIANPIKGSCKEIVEKYSSTKWYDENIQEVYRTIVRDEARKYSAFELNSKLQEIGTSCLNAVKSAMHGKPFEFTSVNIGNIEYPKVVLDSIETKLAKEQEKERKLFELDIAKKDAEIRITEAEGLAKSQEIINQTLTQNYLQHEAIQAQTKLAESPNTTIIYIPVGDNGIPIITTSKGE